MSSKPIFALGAKPFDAYAMSAVGDLSFTFDIRGIVGYSVHTFWSGASATDADVLIQGSNDGTNFVTIDTVDIGAAAGAELFNVERGMYQYIRIYFDKNSETTGSLTVALCGKSL